MSTAVLVKPLGRGSEEGGCDSLSPTWSPREELALCSWQKCEITRFHVGCDYIWGSSCLLHSSCQAVSLGSHSCPPGWDMGNRGGLPRYQATRRPKVQDPAGSQSPFHRQGNVARGGWPALLPTSCEVWASPFLFLNYIIQDGLGYVVLISNLRILFFFRLQILKNIGRFIEIP